MANNPDESWSTLRKSLFDVVDWIRCGCSASRPVTVLDKMKAYSLCYEMCSVQRLGKLVYERLQSTIENEYLASQAESLNSLSGEVFLESMTKNWTSHLLVVKWCTLAFSYLDQFHTKTGGLATIDVMMLKTYSKAVYGSLKDQFSTVVLQQIENERRHRAQTGISSHTMKAAIDLLIKMGLGSMEIYKDFEDRFLKNTAKYYHDMANDELSPSTKSPISNYLIKVEERIREEEKRLTNYLDSSSSSALMACVNKELIGDHVERILTDDEGCEGLAVQLERFDKERKTEGLARMYRLLKRVEKGPIQMAVVFREYIKMEGKGLNDQLKTGSFDGSKYVDACMELHDKYSHLIKNSFDTDSIFVNARKEAFEVFLNDALESKKSGDESAIAIKTNFSDILSMYCHNLMKMEKITPDEFEQVLEKSVSLFMYISDKDRFKEYYRKYLARRLLDSKGENDNERQLISKLELKMGGPYTSQFRQMIKDKAVIVESQNEFRSYCERKEITLSVDFTAQVLTAGHWPSYPVDSINLPGDLQTVLVHFKGYYDEKSSGRKLQWIHSLGSALVSAKFKNLPKEMATTTHQACLLCLFNTASAITAISVATELGIPFEDVKRVLHALVNGKYPILKKDGDKKKIVESDTFSVNEDFTCKERKFKIPNVVKSEKEDVEKATDDSRRYQMEACIVRIMKSRKQMTNNELHAECIRQLSVLFKPDPKDIKKRIEELIQRQYLERDEDDRTIYRYLA